VTCLLFLVRRSREEDDSDLDFEEVEDVDVRRLDFFADPVDGRVPLDLSARDLDLDLERDGVLRSLSFLFFSFLFSASINLFGSEKYQ
jgi:hypothetical protein